MRSAALCGLAATLCLIPATLMAQALDQPQGGQTRPQPQRPTPAPPQKPAPPKKPTPKAPVDFRIAFVADFTAMKASETFEALTGSSWFTGYGGEADLLNLWRGLYVRVGFVVASRNGERAFHFAGEDPISTGVPITIGVNSLEISAGLRRELKKHPKYEWYVGGGFLGTQYSETSDFAESGDDVSQGHRGFVAHAGLDVALTKNRTWFAGFETQYRHVPDAFGSAGLSATFSETSLGGVTLRGLVGYRLRRK